MVSGRSLMTRKRWVTFSTFTTTGLGNGCSLDIEDKIILVFAKYAVSDQQGGKGTYKRCRHRLPPWQHPVINGQSETVDHVEQRIEFEKPLAIHRYEIEPIDDRREVKPGRQYHLHDVGHVPVIHVGRGKKESYAQSKDEQRQHGNGEVEPRHVDGMAHQRNQDRQRYQRQQKVN